MRNDATSKDVLRYTDAVSRRLKKKFGAVVCPLQYRKPHELTIAVILSAQCTDERVNLTTPALFKRFPRPEDYIAASLSEIEKLIYSTGFYRNKARSIQGFCCMLIEDFKGVLPEDAKVLETMPGIGRKTANVVAQVLFGIASGVVVDTHVARISRLLGLTNRKEPAKIEKDLQDAVRKKHWIDWSLYMIYLGRYCCKARVRDCAICPLSDICPSTAP